MHTMASDSDDIDAGWDDEPTRIQPALSSAARHSVPSAAPPTPAAVTARPRGLAASSESLSPSTSTVVTVPRSVLPPSRTRFIVKLALAAALAATAGFSVRRATLAGEPGAAAQRNVPAQPVEQVAGPARTAVAAMAPPAITVPPAAPASAAAAPIPTVNASSLAAAEPVAVTVRVKSIPEGAIFFESGKRLGTSVVEVAVAPRTKRYFTALLNGYEPLNFKVDGTRSQLSVRLSAALTPQKAGPSEPADASPATSEQPPEQ